MKIPFWLSAATLLAVGAASTYAITAQDKKPVDKKAIEAAWTNYATPGEGHKILNTKVGTWTFKMKDFTQQPPSESTGTAEAKWIMDGRYIEDRTTGSFNGMNFQGLGHCGFDNIKKKFWSAWLDNMSTGVMFSEGTYDAATKTFTFHGECPDPLTGKFVKSRMIEKIVDNDHLTGQVFSPGDDGKEMLKYEFQYTRSK